jgi:alkaline phosphatase
LNIDAFTHKYSLEVSMRTRPQGVHRQLLLLSLVFLLGLWLADSAPVQAQSPKYVFVFLADGGGIAHMEITRQYNRVLHNTGMVIADKIMAEGTLGLMTTHAADSLTTDSAAAATAMALGCKAKLGVLGICADGTLAKSAVEVARERGMKIALVTNATVYDASPAAFSTHIADRRQYRPIIDRYIDIAPDVLMGGGREQFTSGPHATGRKSDSRDFIPSFTNKGYSYVTNKQELEQVRKGKVLGLFAKREMSFEIDRDKQHEPSIYDMTKATIRLLSEDNPRGFFAFIETENIDTAAHLSDIAALIQDYREFDRAVGLAYEFYKKNPLDTLILVTSDHETGGLGFTMALKDLNGAPGVQRLSGTPDDLKKIESIRISLRKATEILGRHPSAAGLDRLMKDYFSGFTLAPDIREAILKHQPLSRTLFIDMTAHALGMMVANNTQAYWETASHTNHPVFVAAIGPGAEHFRGYQDNIDFGKNLKLILEGRASSKNGSANLTATEKIR